MAFKITPLHHAVQSGNVSKITKLLSRGHDPNARTELGSTPLHWAAIHSTNERVFEILIGEGADEDALTNSNHTPLQMAEAHGNGVALKALKRVC